MVLLSTNSASWTASVLPVPNLTWFLPSLRDKRCAWLAGTSAKQHNAADAARRQQQESCTAAPHQLVSHSREAKTLDNDLCIAKNRANIRLKACAGIGWPNDGRHIGLPGVAQPSA